MPHTTEDPELGGTMKDPRDTLIEAQREYIELRETCYNRHAECLSNHGVHDSWEEIQKAKDIKNRIQAAEKAIKGE